MEEKITCLFKKKKNGKNMECEFLIFLIIYLLKKGIFRNSLIYSNKLQFYFYLIFNKCSIAYCQMHLSVG